MKQRSADRGRIAGEEAPFSQAPTVGSLGRKAGGAIHEGLAACESYEGKPATHRKSGGGVGYAEGGGAAKRYDRPGRKSGGGANFIAGMHMKKGALHAELGVPQSDKIPAGKLDKAAHSDNPKLRKRAVLAKTLSGFHKN